MKVRCTNCRKKFDYENFYGLCPKCGAYNAKPSQEVHEDLHRFYGETDEAVRTHMNDGRAETETANGWRRSNDRPASGGDLFVKIVTLAAAVVIVIGLLGIFSVEYKKRSVPDTASVEVVRASAGAQLSYGNYSYNVWNAVVVTDAAQDRRLPEDTKLIAVYLTMEYTGRNDAYKNRFMPYIFDGKHYVEAAEQFELSEIAEEYGLPGDSLDGYDVYVASERAKEGYVLYLADAECEEITLNLECREDTCLKRIYEVELTPSGWEVYDDDADWYDDWNFWEDDEPFYGFDDFYDWFDYYDDDYDDGYYDYDDDDYGIKNMKGSERGTEACGL